MALQHFYSGADKEVAIKLGLEYLDGPVTPKPEKLPVGARPKAKRRSSPRPKPKGDGGKRGSVPKVPLAKV